MSIIEQRLRLEGFAADERDRIVTILQRKLDRRLSRWEAEKIDLELSIKERDTTSQKVTLECRIHGEPKFVATSGELELEAALHDVRADLFTQVDRHVEKITEGNRR